MSMTSEDKEVIEALDQAGELYEDYLRIAEVAATEALRQLSEPLQPSATGSPLTLTVRGGPRGGLE